MCCNSLIDNVFMRKYWAKFKKSRDYTYKRFLLFDMCTVINAA